MKHKTLKTMLMMALSAAILATPANVKADQAAAATAASAVVSEEAAAADNEAAKDAAAADTAGTADTAEGTQAAVTDAKNDEAPADVKNNGAATDDPADTSVGSKDVQADAKDGSTAAAGDDTAGTGVSDEGSSEDLKTYDPADYDKYMKALAKAKGTDEMTGADEEGSEDDLSNAYGIFDIAGLKYDKNSPASNLTRLNRHVTYDLEYYIPTDYLHPHYATVCGKAGYILFALPAGYGDKVVSFQVLESLTEDSTGVVVADLKKSNTKAVYKINSPSFFPDKDCYAVYFNKFNLKQIRYYSIRPIEAGGIQGDGGYSYAFYPSPDMVTGVETVTVNAAKVRIYWKHDACVKKYEIYRSLKHVTDFAEDEDKNDLTKYELRGTISGTAPVKKGLHSYVDKVPDADNAYYYIIRPIITPQLAQEDYYNILYCSDPVAGEASVSKAKVKSFKASVASLGKFKLTWKGLKNVSQYTITRYKNNVYDYEFEYDVTKKQTATQEYTDNDTSIALGVNYHYTIRPTSDSADGKKTKSGVVRSVPTSISGLKADKRSNNRGAYVSWNDNGTERKAAERLDYEYRYQIKIDNGDWQTIRSSNYDDTSSLKAGTKRTYSVRVACVRGSKTVTSDEVSCTFKISDSISIKNGDGSDMSSDTMYVAVNNTSYYRAYSSSGSDMSVHSVDGNSYADFSGSMRDGYLYIYLRGNRVGEQRIKITSDGGGSKEVKINVVPQ